jgi:hypothetical protein
MSANMSTTLRLFSGEAKGRERRGVQWKGLGEAGIERVTDSATGLVTLERETNLMRFDAFFILIKIQY